MSFLREDVSEWLLDLAQVPNDPVLADMHAEAKERGFPIVGPEVGRLLGQLAMASGAKAVFELGSGFGYSTLWFARAVGEGGHVHHTEGDPENTRKAEAYMERAGLRDRVTFSTGDARDILEATPGTFDIVFMDIDKEQYPDGYRLFSDRVNRGGLVIVDNLVWGGKIAEGVDDESTRGVREYIDLMWNDDRYLSSLMPVRDGVGVSLRVK